MYSSLSVCLSVSNFAQKNFRTDLHEIFREGWQWANEQMIKFWWRSGSRIWIRIAKLIRRALAEVCDVPEVLVIVIITSPRRLCFRRCLSVSNFAQKLPSPRRTCMKFSWKVGNGPMNNRLNFGGDPDHRLDTGIVFRI